MPKGRSRGTEPDSVDRRAKLFEYRRRKVPYTAFYEELGYASANAASKDFHRALEEHIAELRTTVEVYREEQLLELEYLAEIAHKVLTAHYYQIAPGGKVVRHPETDEPLTDPGPKLAAMDRILKINGQVAKLRGTESATRIEGAITVDALDRALAEAREQLAALDGEDPQDGGTESSPS